MTGQRCSPGAQDARRNAVETPASLNTRWFLQLTVVCSVV
jgi:hypothetical protein